LAYNGRHMKKILMSIKNALRGLVYAYKWDKSFRLEVWGSAGFVVVSIFLWPLSGVEFILLTLSYFLILITELINTAVEQMLERLHPEKNEFIGKSKDIASAAVFMAFIFAIVVVAILLQTRFF